MDSLAEAATKSLYKLIHERMWYQDETHIKYNVLIMQI